MIDHANPLLAPWGDAFGLPPFQQLRAEHFVPAFEIALAEHRVEIETLIGNGDAASFDNSIAAFDRSGQTLKAIERVFLNLAASESSPELQAAEREMAPRLAAHHSAIFLNEALFKRVDAVHAQRLSLGLGAEQLRLVERVQLDFVFAGAKLGSAARERLGSIVQRLAELSTQFSQNVLADESSYKLVLRNEADLAGLPESLRLTARAAAEQRGEAEAWVITLSRSLIVPFLMFSERRDLREQAFKAWTRRGENVGAQDNRAVATEILALRNEQARLHGYSNFAEFALVDRMAGAPMAVDKLLKRVWAPALAKAERERDALREIASALGDRIELQPWDWRYYAEKLRQQRYDLDDAAVAPYFCLERMTEAAFDCAGRLFGLKFIARPELAAYHPDVRVYEVRNREDAPVGIFMADNFARPTKRGGAWMSAYRWQSRAHGEVLPVIVNNNNFARGAQGKPTLLSADDVRTLFHEFGHGLHGLLSQVDYERLSGTHVLRDFVELPSQLFEHWAFEPEVLQRHARHYLTDEPIPPALVKKLEQARRFNQGFETVEYTACALVDMALHAQTDAAGIDITKFEAAELERIGMPREIVMRHRLPHFGHLFSGSSYAAGYYVYMWAEVLDADGYAAFQEAGDPFDPAVAARLLRYVYSSGNTLAPELAYRSFRGRDATVEPMLAKRGLIEALEPA